MVKVCLSVPSVVLVSLFLVEGRGMQWSGLKGRRAELLRVRRGR